MTEKVDPEIQNVTVNSLILSEFQLKAELLNKFSIKGMLPSIYDFPLEIE